MQPQSLSNDQTSNVQVPANSQSISELLTSLKEPVRKIFSGQTFMVYGDVEKVKPWNSLVYVTLIDKTDRQNYSLSVLINNAVIARGGCRIEEKMKILVTGTVTLVRNEIQIVATSYEDLGHGRLQRQIEEWKVTYQQLFKRDKKSLPFICRKIAVISNPQIQGLEDFATHLRYGEVTVFETKMQGNTIAEQIAELIRTINSRNQYDCVCIVRGGGGFTDLFEFNKPVLLEAIASSGIPVITAIGHETDYPLCDFAADIRFSTPTDAGRKLTERMEELLQNIKLNFWSIQTVFLEKIEITSLIIKKIDNEIQMGYSIAEQRAAKKRLQRQKRNILIGAIVIIGILLLIIIKLLFR